MFFSSPAPLFPSLSQLLSAVFRAHGQLSVLCTWSLCPFPGREVLPCALHRDTACSDIVLPQTCPLSTLCSGHSCFFHITCSKQGNTVPRASSSGDWDLPGTRLLPTPTGLAALPCSPGVFLPPLLLSAISPIIPGNCPFSG